MRSIGWWTLLAVGCSGGEAPAPPPITVISPATEGATEGVSRFDEVAFPCCEPQSVATVVTAYDAVADALAADDAPAAATRAKALQDAAGAAIAAPEGLDQAALDQLGTIQGLAGRMVASGSDIEGMRAELVDLVEPAIGLALNHQGGSTKVAISYCPMATPPGRWLQDSSPLANPYYGAQMLRCGVFETREEAGFAAAGGDAQEASGQGG